MTCFLVMPMPGFGLLLIGLWREVWKTTNAQIGPQSQLSTNFAERPRRSREGQENLFQQTAIKSEL
jgi:hypothetical protein